MVSITLSAKYDYNNCEKDENNVWTHYINKLWKHSKFEVPEFYSFFTFHIFLFLRVVLSISDSVRSYSWRPVFVVGHFIVF